MKKIKELEDTETFQKLASLWDELLKREAKVNFKVEVLNERERFLYELFDDVLDLNRKLVLLDFPIKYIETEYRPMFDNVNLNNNYYNYHYENFVIRFTSIFDYCLLFINKTYMLGNPPNLVNMNIISKNENIDTSVIKAINEMNNSISEIRTERNKIIHQGKQSNEILELINNNDIPSNEIEPKFDDQILERFNFNKEKGIEGLLIYMAMELSKFKKSMINLFNALNPRIQQLINEIN